MCLLLVVGLLPVLTGAAGCSSVLTSMPTVPRTAASRPATEGLEPVTAVTATQSSEPATLSAPMTFAVIGDYGVGNAHELAVSQLVASWMPEFVITTGDNYSAQAGGKGTGRYALSVGAYYGSWLRGASAARFGIAATATPDAFFPALGNHDYTDAHGIKSYLDYFSFLRNDVHSSSGNERYYDFVEGPVHFFVLDSNLEEPDGTSNTSRQARWLQRALAASTSRWNIVYEHQPPYSSGAVHGSTARMQWPYAAWGADAVISGHVHTYERIMRDGIVYFVNGAGGDKRYGFASPPVPGSVVRYNGDWGAQLVVAEDSTLTFNFYNVAGQLVDSYELRSPRTAGK